MQVIKLFIASSAELDSDKNIFDLYLSNKNKVYKDRYIFFEHRTWKDFRSSIRVGRLQDDYNKYIQTCDIVVFLFHTRVGKYTLEEFEIAHKQFLKSKGKKPMIYIYFKNQDGEPNPDIEDFKAKYDHIGHFFDTYHTDEDLLIKFEKQLQILENEGLISPNPIDVKRIVKYGFYFVFLPLLIMVLGYFSLEYLTPLHMTVRVNEVQSIQAIPFDKGELTLTYADKTEKQNIHDEVIFKQIASKYKGEKGRIVFEAKGYESIDTTIVLSKLVELPIRRNHSLETIFGTVKDEQNLPLKGVAVSVQNIKVFTDETGSFTINIPFDQQKEEQRLTAYKSGYQLWDFTSSPSKTIAWKIILRR